MYSVNGICCAAKIENQSEIVGVKVLNNMTLLLTFKGGEKRLFDANELIGPAFDPLKRPDVFRTATVESGIVIWLDGEIDCAPEFMYRHSYHFDEIKDEVLDQVR